MNPAIDVTSLRIFLFRRGGVDALRIRQVIGTICTGSFVNVLDPSEDGIRIARAVLSSGGSFPSLILFQQAEGDARSVQALRRIREQPELRPIPLVIIGEDELELVLPEGRDGVDGFVPLPGRASEIRSLGRELTRSWWKRTLPRSAG